MACEVPNCAGEKYCKGLCRSCYRKREYHANPDKKRQYAQKNREAIRERMKVYQKEYYTKYCEEIKSRTAQYKKRRYKEDPLFRLAHTLRVALNQALKGRSKLGVSALRDLGCSLEGFKAHIESQFKPGMTWENYGYWGWHIDHIKPLAVSDLDNERGIRTAIHFTNLQPMWREENQSKGSRYEQHN